MSFSLEGTCGSLEEVEALAWRGVG